MHLPEDPAAAIAAPPRDPRSRDGSRRHAQEVYTKSMRDDAPNGFSIAERGAAVATSAAFPALLWRATEVRNSDR